MKRSPLLLAVLAAACGTDPVEDGSANPATEGATVEVVPEGKADNYFSTNGREYRVSGTDRFDLARLADEDDEAYHARAADFADLRFKAIGWFLHSYVTGKTSHDANYGYGGFRTTVRQRSIGRDDLWAPEEGKFTVKFTTEVGGPKDLVRALGAERAGDDLHRFELTMPRLSAGEVESGSYTSRYKAFKPGDVAPEQLERLTLDLAPEDESLDAYPRYAEMMADGVLDVLIQVGGDYNEARYDRQVARALFDQLQRDLKLKAPVATYDALGLDSGPFTGEIDTPNGPVRIEVYVVHPDMAVEQPQRLVEAFKAHAAVRDVVIYDGHAGYDASYSGVVVTYHPRTALAADAFADLELPEKPQLFFFNGCKTYSVYPDALYDNPAKTPENLDIISTVNFSWLTEMTRITTDFLGAMLRVGRYDGLHEPATFARILSDLNRGRSWDVIYGVHGLDENPHASPYAEPESLCAACGHHADCPSADGLCVNGACGTGCTTDAGCPTGYRCRDVAYEGVISAKQCAPATGRCL